MTQALFSEVELTVQGRPGFRLDTLELYNWGTFDGRVEVLTMGGANALVTGDIGSGKSTLVDAVSTLLLPPNRVNYNKAAGADTRERSLRTYFFGHYRSERVESTGASRPVGLRNQSSYSVILARFRNDGFDAVVTLAQVFWMPAAGEQQPRRFYVSHDEPLFIRDDFTDFGHDPADLRRRLRTAGATVADHFPEYGKKLRRLLGIRSDQALDLFHQTISMKSVGNLTDFVRQHMLEPTDTASRIRSLVQHFEDLSRAHDAVRRAREQLAQLDPITATFDEYDRLGLAIVEHTAARDALRLWTAERRLDLLVQEHQLASSEQETVRRRVDEAAMAATDTERSLAGLRQARDGIAGGRLAVIEAELEGHVTRRDERRTRAQAYGALLDAAGLPAIADRESFEEVRGRLLTRQAEAQQQRLSDANTLAERTIDLRAAEKAGNEIKAEIRSLHGRESNIDARSVALRDRLAHALGVDPSGLPFAGELIQVRESESLWRGAAERVLRGFALSILVPNDRYAEAAAWIDAHHLGARLVYFRVGDVGRRRSTQLPEESVLADVLEVRPGPFAAWVTDELHVRADHARVEGAQQLSRHRRAVTRQGQVKTDRRHEKDDRFAIDDRTRWVLGWSNQDKVQALLQAAASATTDLEVARKRLADAERDADRRSTEQGLIGQLLGYREWTDLDWRTSTNRIADLEAERTELERGNAELGALQRRIAAIEDVFGRVKAKERSLTIDLGRVEGRLNQIATMRDEIAAWLAGIPEAEQVRMRVAYPVLERRHSVPGTLAECDRTERDLSDELTRVIDGDRRRQALAGERGVRLIAAFRQAWPSETVELGADVAAANEYRELRERIATDDLPRFEAEFKKQLNTNTINDVAGFQAWLDKSARTIETRISTINESLGAIDYNPGTRINLLAERTTHQEVRAFREDLRACTDDALSRDDQYSEERFAKVKAIIERFRGREGHTDVDRRWTDFVTDVRNWYVFAASERDRDSDAEREHYTDSDGKSGGQKEKLAYTILAASLAYQFGLEWGVAKARDFRFTVIDEAFGRGSDVSTRYALELFGKLGLQLLVVTPLQKVHVIEPYVSAVGFVENRTGQRSRLQTLTIEEYQAERERTLQESRSLG